MKGPLRERGERESERREARGGGITTCTASSSARASLREVSASARPVRASPSFDFASCSSSFSRLRSRSCAVANWARIVVCTSRRPFGRALGGGLGGGLGAHIGHA